MTDRMPGDLPDEIRELRDRIITMQQSAPAPPPALLEAEQRLRVLEMRLSQSDDVMSEMRLGREMAAVAQGMADMVRQATSERRNHRRALFELRRELHQRLLPLHESEIAGAMSRVGELIADALAELDRLDRRLATLVEQGGAAPARDNRPARVRRALQHAQGQLARPQTHGPLPRSVAID